jgi:hypothetical protein
VLIAAVTALALGAAPARADSILYRCFPNLCRVAPDGSGRAQLTRDATDGGPVYAWLSATVDGSRLGGRTSNGGWVGVGFGPPGGDECHLDPTWRGRDDTRGAGWRRMSPRPPVTWLR